MSYFSSRNARFTRGPILASVAVLALIASGATGEMAWSESAPLHAAAAAAISDSQAQSVPSFASLIARVKPAVVSVQVEIANAATDMSDPSG